MRCFRTFLFSAIIALGHITAARSDEIDRSVSVEIRVFEARSNLPVESRLLVTYPDGDRESYHTEESGVLVRQLNECSPSVRIRVIPDGYSHQVRTVICDDNPLEIAVLRMQLRVEWSMLTDPGSSVALEAIGGEEVRALYGDLLAAMETGQTNAALSLARELQALTANSPEFANSFSALAADLGLAEITDGMTTQEVEALAHVPADLFFQTGEGLEWNLSGKGSDYLEEFQRQFGLTASGAFDDQTFDFIQERLPQMR